MPAKHILKIYLPNSFYHLYNRGVNKQLIFKDQQDYGVFLGYLKEYLSPDQKKTCLRQISIEGKIYKTITPPCKNYHQEIILLAYCLMPNHFHLLIKQTSDFSITSFMKSLFTRYTMYFNKRYQRIGPLFQSRYKAILINNENQLTHLSRYIHLNPHKLKQKQPSSLSDYLGLTHTPWLHPEIILEYFSAKHSYKKFVDEQSNSSESILEDTTLEE